MGSAFVPIRRFRSPRMTANNTLDRTGMSFLPSPSVAVPAAQRER